MSRSRLGDEHELSLEKVQNRIPKLWHQGWSTHLQGKPCLLVLGRSLMVGSWRKTMEGKVVEMERNVGERADGLSQGLGVLFYRN